MAGEVYQRVEFTKGKSTKLIPKHKHIAFETDDAKCGVAALMADPYGGHRRLLRALLREGWPSNKPLTLDVCSDLIDRYREIHGKADDLHEKILTAVAEYMGIELKKGEDEEERPTPATENEDSPV
jgi:hypothetical protein